ncbi:AfsR/SARP family transcriptional regulator [Nocardiopsis alborubida]|uniref:AfsR/SARP family transcriptional regulator n=1 Tax=Nocardiopsis alborubida TaxID=146802 RepID=A0A7X6MA27_9ACTN|nr:AfsR/SARP family transcriptional regulator [Nocardiopsis alborubida]NKY97169.1 AfsR/SARP family transcriptional regulator [Nocardiopsis alborubida]
MTFRVLGMLEVGLDDRTYSPTGGKIRQLLALFLCRANEVVSPEALMEELWGDAPPRSATVTLQSHVYQLRRALDRAFPEAGLGRALVTRSRGYMFSVPEGRVDALEFERLVLQARRLAERGRPTEALEASRAARNLWRGEVLSDVQRGPLLNAHAVRLAELRLTAIRACVAADMDLFRYGELVPQLRTLVAYYPFDEWFHVQLIRALAGDGRRGDALLSYDHVCRLLDEELGLEPSAELRRLRAEILSGDVRRFRGRPARDGSERSPSPDGVHAS